MPTEQGWWRKRYSFGDNKEAIVTIAIPPLPKQESLPKYRNNVVVRSLRIVVELKIKEPHFVAFSPENDKNPDKYEIHKAGEVYPVRKLSSHMVIAGWPVESDCSLLFLNTEAVGPLISEPETDKHPLRHRQFIIQGVDLPMLKIIMLPKINSRSQAQIVAIRFDSKDIEPAEWLADSEWLLEEYNQDFGFSFHRACQELHQATRQITGKF